jgi:hypothetical protein
LLSRTLRRVAVVGSTVIVLVASAAPAAIVTTSGSKPAVIAQPATITADSTNVPVIDQNDAFQYAEAWDWSAEWRMLRWYGRTLVVVFAVLLLPVLWCGGVLCVGTWRVVRARRHLARVKGIESAVDAAFRAIDAQRRHLEREIGRVL